ncbi:MAG: ankyrin repeat domain-containing protein [Candidatus Chromulinivorax sp.]|nr:ankyrin repeat domain-containing protein [Candidatus Chromulinivorax sp.]
MKNYFLVLFALCCATQTMCSTENIVPKSHDSEDRERTSLIKQSCSSEHFNISHKYRIPAQHGIPTLHEMAFKKLEPTITEAITDLIDNKYDDERDKQNKLGFIELIAEHSPHVLNKFINAPTNDFNTRLLYNAVRANNPEITQYLLDAGALVNQQNNDGTTPLHYAAYESADKAIPLLIDAGADITIRNQADFTPRMLTNGRAALRIFDQAIAARQLKQKSATKIQALGRGFITRKNK